jgi:Protein of unknown function (DUF2798)
LVDQTFKLPKRYGHFIFSVIQSCLTCAVAAAIAHFSLDSAGPFISHWLRSWLLSWITILPIALLAAPFIRRVISYLTDDGA